MQDRAVEMCRHVEIKDYEYHSQASNGRAQSHFGSDIDAFERRARKISWSTSQGEMLFDGIGQELGQKFMLAQITDLWTAGIYMIHKDHVTDCGDFYKLIIGNEALPQDKSQRLYVAAFRKLRINGRVSSISLAYTKDMLAEALRKPKVSWQTLCLMTTCKVTFRALVISTRMLVRHDDLCDDRSTYDVKQLDCASLIGQAVE